MNAPSTLAGLSAGPQGIAVTASPRHRLFDRISVLIASLLGSPVAGAVLMAINQWRWGHRNRALGTVLIAVLATTIICIGAYLTHLDSLVPQYEILITVACALLTAQAAQAWQGEAIKAHLSSGGEIASRWAAAGVGLALLVVIAGALVGFALLTDRDVVIGSRDKVHYSAQATKAEATRLGQVLKSIGYFSDRGVDVFLSKPADSVPRVSFVVQEGTWDQPESVAGFERVGLLVASQSGFPLHVILVNGRQEPQKDLIIGRVIVGTRDVLYYLGSSTQSQARTLGEALRSAGYLQDSGVAVLLAKEGEATSLSFPVVEGAWDKQEATDYFVDLTRRSLPVVGATRIRLRLMNSNLEIKRELLVTEH